MARADLLVDVVRAGATGDQERFRRTVEALVADERSKQHHVLADRLAEYLNGKRPIQSRGVRTDSSAMTADFVIEKVPRRHLFDLALPDLVRLVCTELVEEQNRADLLRSYGMEPRNRVLAVGPPGNGKTSLAEALALEVAVPLLTVDYGSLIGSFLGETATRLSLLFDAVRRRPCVLFFDEFDTIGKERGDVHETGEIKRVVSSLLLEIDRLPEYVIVVAATNHEELLDRAAWRRFQVRVSLTQPTLAEREEFLRNLERRTDTSLGLTANYIARKLSGASYSEIEDFFLDCRRRGVLSEPGTTMREIVGTRLKLLASRQDI